jgi:tRNA(His) 5'-end guanylyltransferase
MKRFNELSTIGREKALNKCIADLIEAIASGAVRFNDELNHDDLQKRIDKAFADMERNQTPWFIGERLMEDEVISESIRGMAECDAEDALYAEDGEHFIGGIA